MRNRPSDSDLDSPRADERKRRGHMQNDRDPQGKLCEAVADDSSDDPSSRMTGSCEAASQEDSRRDCASVDEAVEQTADHN